MAPDAYEFVEGEINKDALEQDVHWFDRTGQLYLITNMTRRHCHGAMKKLFNRFGGRVATTPLFKALQEQAER